MNEAQKEIDIISPWISYRVKNDKEYIHTMKNALDRGVKIKILTGIGNDSLSTFEGHNRREATEKYVQSWLQFEFNNYKDSFFIKLGNTHIKLLLCDEKYHMSGSFNILSFDGKYDTADLRDEAMDIISDKDMIVEKRNLYFDF